MSIATMLRRTALVAASAVLASGAMVGVSSAAKPGGPGTPATPAAVALASANKSLAVSWTESSTGIITYTATAKASGKATRSCVTKRTSCSIVALMNGVIYDVTVVASNTAGSSAPSADVTQIVGVPSAPLMVHTTAGTAMATIAWNPPKASGVANVTTYIATASPGGFSCTSTGTLLTPPARTCQIPGLTSGTTYTVTVTAANAYGASSPSKPATVTPS
jgi:hypothetical protein